MQHFTITQKMITIINNDIIKLYSLDHIYDADINVETDEIAQRYLINKGQLK